MRMLAQIIEIFATLKIRLQKFYKYNILPPKYPDLRYNKVHYVYILWYCVYYRKKSPVDIQLEKDKLEIPSKPVSLWELL